MKTIKLLFMDIDGTMTDGKIYIGNNGEMMKAFSVRDGYGIKNILKDNAIIPVVVTSRESKIVANRCAELDIVEVYQNCRDKEAAVEAIARKYGLESDDENGVIPETAYIGDDIPDLPAMKRCEYICCPADAVEEIRAVAHYISKNTAGNGAVRECIEWLVDR